MVEADVGFEFVLYIAGSSLLGARALHHLRRACESHLGGRYKIRVVDVQTDTQEAEKEQVLATPTLIRLRPTPRFRLVGDLADERLLLAALGVPAPREETRA